MFEYDHLNHIEIGEFWINACYCDIRFHMTTHGSMHMYVVLRSWWSDMQFSFHILVLHCHVIFPYLMEHVHSFTIFNEIHILIPCFSTTLTSNCHKLAYRLLREYKWNTPKHSHFILTTMQRIGGYNFEENTHSLIVNLLYRNAKEKYK